MALEWLDDVEEAARRTLKWGPAGENNIRHAEAVLRLVAAVRECAARADLLETALRTLVVAADGLWESEALDGLLDEDDPQIQRFNEALDEAEDALRVVGDIHAPAG